MKFASLQGVLAEPLDSVFRVARELGFDGVELDWRTCEEVENDGSLAPEKRAAIRQAAQAAGVEIHAVAAHFLNAGGIASEDESVQEFGLAAIRQGIKLCCDLGATALLVPFFGSAEMSNETAVVRLKNNLKVLSPAAEAANVTLAIEHTLRGDVAAKVLSGVASAHVGDYFDMANCMSLGYDPLEEISRLRGYIARVHAKEFQAQEFQGAGLGGERAPGSYPGLNTVAFGHGNVPVKKVLSALHDTGYDGYITLETGAFGDNRASARAALEVLRSAL